MITTELQKKFVESKIDKVCMFAFNELATFVDWYAETQEINEHYQNDILLLMNKMNKMLELLKK
ncbi:MAG: hypothetical protein J6S85_01790 [Methanobrevibacter sp.]|nr:hypothetical protein [Methanobrevibacter sp.]MBO7712267.1 hypothetical protein [Methanobrevibacter sp.]